MAPPQRDQGMHSLPRRDRSRADLAVAERLLAAARTGADVRARKVRRLRAAIKLKAYENDLKLAVAVENMLATLRETNPPPAPLARDARVPKHEFRNKLRV